MREKLNVETMWNFRNKQDSKTNDQFMNKVMSDEISNEKNSESGARF